MELKNFWAKTNPFQSVLTHGLVSGYVAQALVRQYLSTGTKKLLQNALKLDEEGFVAFAGYLVSMHDIGKIECHFQAKDPDMRERLHSEPDLLAELAVPIPDIRHEKTSQACVTALWELAGEDEDSIDLFGPVIGVHHPGRYGKGNFRRKSKLIQDQAAYEAFMRAIFLGETEDSLPNIREECEGIVGALLLAILTLADWISSGPAFSDAEKWMAAPNPGATVREKTKDFLQRSGLSPQRYIWPKQFSELWPWIPTGGRRPLQAEVENLLKETKNPSRVILLEAPMGEGKTEAGMYAAMQLARYWGKDGFYVALPTAATSNQMVTRMRELLASHDLEAGVRLLHGTAWLESTESIPKQSEESDGIVNWLAPVRRGLLGQFSVGTVDQAMLAATNVKYGMLRLLGLSNKVLVIDEIHSYDAYMSTILVRLLEWCKALEIPVVMLSATLPPAKKEDLLRPFAVKKLSDGYPLITAIGADGNVIEHKVSGVSHFLKAKTEMLPILNHPNLIADAAIRLASNGGCICVLLNTVREAQEVYTAIRQKYDGDLLLFHAQFLAKGRAELETLCIRRYGKDRSCRPERSILVATQVVEQSLDVDFDAMITAIAPIDLLIQRLGRVHRHDGAPRPRGLEQPLLQVLIPAEGEGSGSSRFVYPECLLKSSMRLLENIREIRVPEDLADLVRRGYDPTEAPSEELEQWQNELIKEQVESGASQQFLANPPDKQYNALIDTMLYDDEDRGVTAATRLGEPTIRLALLEPPLYEKLLPFCREKNGTLCAEIWDKTLAEEIMLQSVSVRNRRKGWKMSDFWDIKGDKLLSGTRIFLLTDGVCCLSNGAQIRNDPNLGIQIKEGDL